MKRQKIIISTVLLLIIGLSLSVLQPVSAQHQFNGDITDAWFKISGPLESWGVAWNQDEVLRLKQGIIFYLRLSVGDGGVYTAEVYSFINNCYQKQGVIGNVTVKADILGNNAFFTFDGVGISYRDDALGQWCPVASEHVLWGILKLNKKDDGRAGYDKMRIEFRLLNIFDDGVQFGQLKGSSVAAPSPICLDSCPTI